VDWSCLHRQICSPIASFTDDLDFKVVDSTGRRDGLCGTHTRSIFMCLPYSCNVRHSQLEHGNNDFINKVYSVNISSML